jgi:hypothetical protein
VAGTIADQHDRPPEMAGTIADQHDLLPEDDSNRFRDSPCSRTKKTQPMIIGRRRLIPSGRVTPVRLSDDHQPRARAKPDSATTNSPAPRQMPFSDNYQPRATLPTTNPAPHFRLPTPRAPKRLAGQ